MKTKKEILFEKRVMEVKAYLKRYKPCKEQLAEVLRVLKLGLEKT